MVPVPPISANSPTGRCSGRVQCLSLLLQYHACGPRGAQGDFPYYRYHDMVQSGYRLITQG